MLTIHKTLKPILIGLLGLGLLITSVAFYSCEANIFGYACGDSEQCSLMARELALEGDTESLKQAEELVQKAYDKAETPTDESWAILADYSLQAERCVGGVGIVEEIINTISSMSGSAEGSEPEEPIYQFFAPDAETDQEKVDQAAEVYACLNDMQDILRTLPEGLPDAVLESDFRIHRMLTFLITLPFRVQDTSGDGKVDMFSPITEDTEYADVDLFSLKGWQPGLRDEFMEEISSLSEQFENAELVGTDSNALAVQFNKMVSASKAARKILAMIDLLRDSSNYIYTDFTFVAEATDSHFIDDKLNSFFGHHDLLNWDHCDMSALMDFQSFEFDETEEDPKSMVDNAFAISRRLEEVYALIGVYMIAIQEAIETADAMSELVVNDWETLVQWSENIEDASNIYEELGDITYWKRCLAGYDEASGTWKDISSIEDNDYDLKLHIHAFHRGLMSIYRRGSPYLPGHCEASDNLANFNIQKVFEEDILYPDPCLTTQDINEATADSLREPYTEETRFDRVYRSDKCPLPIEEQ